MSDIFIDIKNILNLKDVDIKDYSPLSLAFIGDSFYELAIRSMVVSRGNCPVNKLNKRSSSLAMAKTQYEIVLSLDDFLSEEEHNVLKSGINSKPNSKAKNATLKEYRYATGFEALLGYLYLTNKSDRALEIIKEGINRISTKENKE